MKKFVYLLMSILLLCSFAACGGTSSGTTPTYRGMTISRASAGGSAVNTFPTPPLFSEQKNDHIDRDETLSQDIEDLVTIEVLTDDSVKYYVAPGETFLLEVHLANPEKFEIQSFTLNGEKYANYMFKDGSTMERLLLEVTAPTTPGYFSYTIDAIKYIDGTEIKDVDMSSGNKSIKAGISYTSLPTAAVTPKNVLPTSATFAVSISDPDGLIGENKLAIYLSDGEKVVAERPLTVGDNAVIFDNLTMSKTYEYGIVTAFDMIDGRNLHEEWLVTDTFMTASIFGFSDIAATQSAITFSVTQNGENGQITKISLYDAVTDMLVASGNGDIRRFDNLFTDHAYHLYIDFTYTQNGNTVTDWTAVKNFKTLPKTAPTVTIGNLTPTGSTVSGNFSMNDPDKIGAITAVAIHKNGSPLKTNSEGKIDFSNLDYFTDYQVVITYTYDLGDGNGKKTEQVKKGIKTAPYLAFKSFSVINTSAVSEGETIFLRVNIENPNGLDFQTVTVNGKEYAVAKNSTTATMLVCEIVNNNQFEGGTTVLTIEKVVAALDGTTYTILPEANNTASVFINGRLEVERVEVVVKEGNDYLKKDYLFPSDNAFVMLTLKNKTGYTVDTIEMNGQRRTDFQKLNNEQYLLRFSGEGVVNCFVTEIRYSSGTLKKTLSVYATCEAFVLTGNTVHYISTPDDLLTMNDTGYYELTGNIDLAGIEWQSKDFFGVLNGKGYAIQNMSFVGTANEGASMFGLFGTVSGVIQDLHLKNVMVVVKSDNPNIMFGGFAAQAKSALLVGCTVDENSYINFPGNYVGGIVGYADATIKDCVNYAVIGGNNHVGGIAGQCEGSITNCQNYGAVSGNDSVGGIVGNLCGRVADCQNRGTVKGYSNTGGIAGVNSSELGSTVENCQNYGAITAENSCGGIVCGNHGIIRNCQNFGNITATGSVGGIVSENHNENSQIIACQNNGTVTGSHSLGGIAYYSAGTVADCLNSGKLIATSKEAVTAGGILGQNSGIFERCINTGELVILENISSIRIGSIAALNYGTLKSAVNFGNIPKVNHTLPGGTVGDAGENTTTELCYALGENATATELNDQSFYVNKLGFDPALWDFNDLDVENGKYPTLK